jgi:hypothetical protein
MSIRMTKTMMEAIFGISSAQFLSRVMGFATDPSSSLFLNQTQSARKEL